MCILLVYFNPEPFKQGFKLILAHNRDEYFDRPSQPATYLDKNSNILCGTDLTNGPQCGTWLGICKKTGALAGLLNIPTSRVTIDHSNAPLLNNKSRGTICLNYLDHAICSNYSFPDYIGLRFSLVLLGPVLQELGSLKYYNSVFKTSNPDNGRDDLNVIDLKPGIYSFGNSRHPSTSLDLEIGPSGDIMGSSTLHPKWKKLARAKEIITSIIDDYNSTLAKDGNVSDSSQSKSTLTARLLAHLLQDKTKNLPDANFEQELGIDYGFGNEELYHKSSIFVEPFRLSVQSKDFPHGRWYGTRCQTVILIDDHGNVTFTESSLQFSRNFTEINELREISSEWIMKEHAFKIGA